MDIIVACKGVPLIESVNFAKEKNIGVEIKSFCFSKVFSSDLQGLLTLTKKNLKNFNGLRSLHGMIYDYALQFDRNTIKEFKNNNFKYLEIANELEAKILVVHSTYFPGLTTWQYKDWLSWQQELWFSVASEAKKNDITVVIENIVDDSPDCILDILKSINVDNLKACIDFGHLNLIANNTILLKWIDALQDYLYYTHIHNNNGRYDSHSEIDNGLIDYKAVFNKLMKLQILPKIAIEVDRIDDVESSLNKINQITCLT